MPPQIAFVLTTGLVVWLLARDRSLRGGNSSALWIPVLWLGIIGSRPVTSWLGLSPANADSDGSPYDRLVFIGLIVTAFVVLQKRRPSWGEIFSKNKWLFLLLIYYGVTTLWTNDPFVSFKRWIKEIGNVLMVLVILTEENPANAMKSVLFRCACLLIPASAMLINYYPDLGRYYNPFIWTYSYGGVTTDKNALGMTLFTCGLGLYWSFFDLWKQRQEYRQEFYAHLILMVICLWLYAKAHCATAMACSGMGAGIITAMTLPAFRNALQRTGVSGLLIVAVIVFFLSAIVNPVEVVTSTLGRNMTLTGRTDIWREVLQVKIDPLLGAGYCNFWQPERAEVVSKNLGFYFTLKEAHDGYLEVYLNTGLVGLSLVCLLLLTSASKIIKNLGADNSYASFRLAALMGVMFYNITESALSGLVLLWVVLILVTTESPHAPEMSQVVEIEPEFEENTRPA